MAMPLEGGYYKLLVIEQITDKRACWSENGANPTLVEPLLVTFDFTGICGRSTDSNGYSIRVGGEDMGLAYSLRIERGNGELLLVGVSPRQSSAPKMIIARTRGMAPGFQKFILEPGWRFTRRVFNTKTLGHVYFTNESYALATSGSQSTPVGALDRPTETNLGTAPLPPSLPASAPPPLPVPLPAGPAAAIEPPTDGATAVETLPPPPPLDAPPAPDSLGTMGTPSTPQVKLLPPDPLGTDQSPAIPIQPSAVDSAAPGVPQLEPEPKKRKKQKTPKVPKSSKAPKPPKVPKAPAVLKPEAELPVQLQRRAR
jgi:hypothetical protein